MSDVVDCDSVWSSVEDWHVEVGEMHVVDFLFSDYSWEFELLG